VLGPSPGRCCRGRTRGPAFELRVWRGGAEVGWGGPAPSAAAVLGTRMDSEARTLLSCSRGPRTHSPAGSQYSGHRPHATRRQEGLRLCGPDPGARGVGCAALAGTRSTEASGGGGRKGGQAAGKGDDSSRGAQIGNTAIWEQFCLGRRESREGRRSGEALRAARQPLPPVPAPARPWGRGGLFWRSGRNPGQSPPPPPLL
jgi:hypothetical protein